MDEDEEVLLRRYAASNLAVGAFVVLPYAEEFWRCHRADRTLAAHPASEAGETGASRG